MKFFEKVLRYSAASLACLWVFGVTATEFDPADYTVVAYKLTAEQEEQFRHDDGLISEFWSAWDNDRDEKLDYVYMVPLTHGRNPGSMDDGREVDMCPPDVQTGFTSGQDDAQMWVRAAYGEKGLYLYCEVLDDDFVGLIGEQPTGADWPFPYVGSEHWMNDCFDFALDIYGSEEQRSHWLTILPGQQTMTMWQYQYRFGTSEPASIVRLNYADPAWEGWFDSWLLKYDQLSVSEAQAKYGILFEGVATGDKCKTQEWFFPWSKVAAGISMPSQGQKIAAIFQYNDLDMEADKTAIGMDCLFFKDRSNFLNQRADYTVRKYNGGEIIVADNERACYEGTNWGDIEFGGSLAEMTGGETGMPRILPAHSLKAAGDCTGVFGLDGRKVVLQNARGPVHVVTVRRMSDGTVRSLSLKNSVR
jgi:hypothetical protein